ncbi:MAG: bifunctional folylpolyglutamate synthase/dihydrofolate synthase [Clostridia bacterium]|nr:bifunctional folylpolyglutamate synthase/dihydrofolate synthase [Clostridia bacterium]
MTPKGALERIYALPRFNRGETLQPVRDLLAAVREPQKALRFVHVAGTNGKGSISTMCASVLKEAGLRVGLYTSPFINDFRERFQINGTPVSPAEFAAVTREVFLAMKGLPAAEHLSQFDVVTVIGLLIFARAGCDIVVLECGLGGRLDATNVIAPPTVAVIGNIGFDHTELLGDTITAITTEKCGILKVGTRAVVCAPQDYPEAAQTVKERADAYGIPLTQVKEADIALLQCALGSLTFSYHKKTYISGLAATYQAKNAATALEVLFALRREGFAISDTAIADGLRHAYIPARLELMALSPHVLLDGAHNQDGLRALRASIEAVAPTFHRLFCLVGMLREKDPRGALSAFFSSPVIQNKLAATFTITPPTPRACPAQELADMLATLPTPPPCITAHEDMKEALEACLAAMHADDALLCCGSLYTMGDLRRLIREHYHKG